MGCCPTCGQRVAGGDLLIDLSANRVAYAGVIAKLEPIETELLVTLFRGAPGLVPIERIGNALWGVLWTERSRSNITVHIHRMRQKLAPLGIYIENHRECGYSLRCPPSALKDAKRQTARRRAA